jgi:hypothetical protein
MNDEKENQRQCNVKKALGVAFQAPKTPGKIPIDRHTAQKSWRYFW